MASSLDVPPRAAAARRQGLSMTLCRGYIRRPMSRTRELAEQAGAALLLAAGSAIAAVLALPLILWKIESRGKR